MRYNIGFHWWKNQTGNRFNIKKQMWEDHKKIDKVKTESFKDVDFVFNSVPDYNIDKPLITQLCGYGYNYILKDKDPSKKFMQVFDNADIILALDTKIYNEILQDLYLDDETLNKIRVVPLAKRYLPGYKNRSNNYFYVFNPAKDNRIKKPKEFVEASKIVKDRGYDDIKFIQTTSQGNLYNDPVEWLNLDNLILLPEIDFDQMIYFYGLADVIAPFSDMEMFGNTILEAFYTKKPVIVNDLANIQSISSCILNRENIIEDFGIDIKSFDNKYNFYYETGREKHYYQADDSKELANRIIDLYNNYNEYNSKNQLWLDNFWNSKQRVDRIIELYEDLIL